MTNCFIVLNGMFKEDFHSSPFCKLPIFVKTYSDKYDFDMKKWSNPLNWGRNIETMIGHKYAGEGIPFEIIILGRNTWITRPDGAFSSHSYAGQQETIQGFDGQKRKLDYNPAGLVTKVSDYGNASSSPMEIDYVRYGDGKVKTSKVGGDNATAISYTYDVNRNPDTTIDPSLGKLTYDYSGFGEMIYSATPRDTINYVYDVLGRITWRMGLDGISQWVYDDGFKGVVSQTSYNPVTGPAVAE